MKEHCLLSQASRQSQRSNEAVSVEKNCAAVREVYEEVPTLLYQSDNLTSTPEHSNKPIIVMSATEKLGLAHNI